MQIICIKGSGCFKLWGMKPSHILIPLVVAAAIVATVLLVYKPVGENPAGKVRVIAAENFWGDIASQIGGDHVQVTSIINDPTADPHLYESNARTAAQVGAADLVIINGMGYDNFMDKLLAGSP